jgi:hypothetical protein
MHHGKPTDGYICCVMRQPDARTQSQRRWLAALHACWLAGSAARTNWLAALHAPRSEVSARMHARTQRSSSSVHTHSGHARTRGTHTLMLAEVKELSARAQWLTACSSVHARIQCTHAYTSGTQSHAITDACMLRSRSSTHARANARTDPVAQSTYALPGTQDRRLAAGTHGHMHWQLGNGIMHARSSRQVGTQAGTQAGTHHARGIMHARTHRSTG